MRALSITSLGIGLALVQVFPFVTPAGAQEAAPRPEAAQVADAGSSGRPDLNGMPAPALHVAEGAWVNLEPGPTIGSLQGHVLWVEFSFIDCGSCWMMQPALVGLQHRFGPQGLVVIEVDNGAIDSRERLAEEVERRQPNHAVLWDEDGRTCDAFGVTRYGAAYLVGADGRVVWGGDPTELTMADLWSKVRRALREVDVSALKAAGSPWLSRNPAMSSVSVAAAAVDPFDAAAPVTPVRRYDLGWDFAICTDDNTMAIEGVRPGTPAEERGLEVGDIIVAIDGMRLADVPFERLKAALHHMEASPDPVVLRVQRDDQILDIEVAPRPTAEG